LTYRFWTQGSVEHALLGDFDASAVGSAIKDRTNDAIERYGSLSTHLYASTSAELYLGVITRCLVLLTGPSGTRLRQFAFRNPNIKAAVLPGSDVHAEQVNPLVDTLRLGEDALLAGYFVFSLLESLENDKKGKKLPEVRDP